MRKPNRVAVCVLAAVFIALCAAVGWYVYYSRDVARVRTLVSVLDSKDPAVVAAAEAELGRMRSPRCIRVMIAAMKDNKRQEVLYRALAHVGKPAVPYLVDILGYRTPEWLTKIRGDWGRDREAVLSGAWRSLVLIGPDATDSLVAALGDRNLGVRADAAIILGEIRDPRAVSALVAALGEPASNGDGLLYNIARALSSIRDDHCKAALLSGMKSPSPKVRAVCAATLCAWKDADVVDALISELNDSDVDAACRAAGSLGEIRDPRAVEPLIARLKAGRISRRAACALGYIGDERAVDPIIETMGNSRDLNYLGALEIIGTPKARQAVDKCIAPIDLAAIAGDPKAAFRQAYARAVIGQELNLALMRYGTAELAADYCEADPVSGESMAHLWAHARGQEKQLSDVLAARQAARERRIEASTDTAPEPVPQQGR